MICYMYTTGLNSAFYMDELSHDARSPQNRLLFAEPLYIAASMYAIADKYDIPLLKQKAAKAFKLWLSIITRPPRIDDMRCRIKTITWIIPYVYASTPDTDRGLRDKLVESTIRHWEDFDQYAEFQDVLAANPGFICDVMRRMKSVNMKFEEKQRRMTEIVKSRQPRLREFDARRVSLTREVRELGERVNDRVCRFIESAKIYLLSLLTPAPTGYIRLLRALCL